MNKSPSVYEEQILMNQKAILMMLKIFLPSIMKTDYPSLYAPASEIIEKRMNETSKLLLEVNE